MSFCYAKAHLRDLKEKVQKRGNTPEDVLTLAVFYDLTLAQLEELATLCGLTLAPSTLEEYKLRLAAYSDEEVVDALVERFEAVEAPAPPAMRIRSFGKGGKLI